jgi:hypothetical protein
MPPKGSTIVKRTEDVHPLLQRMLELAESTGYDGDSQDAGWEIAKQIMLAETVDDVLNRSQTVTHARDVLDRPFMLLGIEFRTSDINPNQPVFALLTARFAGERYRDDEETELISCGGLNVMAAALRLEELEALPRMVQIHQADKATKAGFWPLWLQAAKVHTLDDGSSF